MGMFLMACKTQKMSEKQVLYSQQAVESLALKTFLSNTKPQQLATAEWDYVPGLVALSVLKVYELYPEKMAYYEAVKAYAEHSLKGGDTIAVRYTAIDDLAAGKIFFTLYETEMKRGNTPDAERYKHCVTHFRNKLKYNHLRIQDGVKGAGFFIHKLVYPNQMWLDGLFMGSPMYAGWQHYFGGELGEKDNFDSWSDIAHQFKTIHQYTYDAEKQLNYHVFAADTDDKNAFWAKKDEPHQGCSPEFWGRGMGWYFAALTDVLEWMPKTHPDYANLLKITQQVAAGLVRYQDKSSGCWYQLLQYDRNTKSNPAGDTVLEKVYNRGEKSNYLESSASSMFTYAYLKGIRLGILDKKIYGSIAEKAYRGLIREFIRTHPTGGIDIIQSCASAGLGPARDPSRCGTINYYLCGNDVAITQNEGKAIGAFILAALEFEMNAK
ncbi:family 88 glycosyl hydrolase [Bacteroidia bacterium]|nr:family 88 glycosyl hydrolase [Bacteroidia bacterium]GHU69714.1 family 88 glycosyl hydrolase [Bacteroidia bacterium]